MSTETLRNNLIGLFLSQNERVEFLKLGHVLALAQLSGIDVTDLQLKYAELRSKRELAESGLKGGPIWISEVAKESYLLLIETLKRINAEKPNILRQASEEAVKMTNLADLIREGEE